MISGVNSLALKTPNQLPLSPLPVVPPRIQDRIVRGEFVDVHESLPERLMLELDDCFTFSVGAGRSVFIRPRSASSQPTRCLVHDMATWLETFTLYFRVLMDALPNLAGKLLAYHAHILEANNNYHSDAGFVMTPDFARQLLRSPTSTPGPQLMRICGRHVLLVVTVRHVSAMHILQRRSYGLF